MRKLNETAVFGVIFVMIKYRDICKYAKIACSYFNLDNMVLRVNRSLFRESIQQLCVV